MCICDVIRGYALFAKTAGPKKGTGRKLPERGNSVGSNPAGLGKNCLTSMTQMIDFWPTKNPENTLDIWGSRQVLRFRT